MYALKLPFVSVGVIVVSRVCKPLQGCAHNKQQVSAERHMRMNMYKTANTINWFEWAVAFGTAGPSSLKYDLGLRKQHRMQSVIDTYLVCLRSH